MVTQRIRCCSKLPARHLRRWLYLILLIILIALSIRFFLQVRQVLQDCNSSNKNDWQCQWQGIKYSDDAQPLVNLGDAAEKWLVGYTSALDGIYGAVSDTARNQALLEWDYDRDETDVSMSRMRCQVAFPALFGEIGRARSKWTGAGIKEGDIDGIEMLDGRVRAGIKGGRLFVIESNLTTASMPRALAVLESLNEAISNPGPSFIPDIEFVFSVERQEEELSQPIWVFDRREVKDDKVWLMPSPGFLFEGDSALPTSVRSEKGRLSAEKAPLVPGSPDITLPSGRYTSGPAVEAMPRRDQLVAAIEGLEATIPEHNKTKKLVGVWTSTDIPQTARRKGLSWAATDRSWAEYDNVDPSAPTLSGIDNRLPTDNSTLSTLSSMCTHFFLAHDSTFHIPLPNTLLCNSILFTTKPTYISLYHSLLLINKAHFHKDVLHPAVQFWASKGAGNQNAVLVADDWGDLDYKIVGLMENEEAARGIAANSVRELRRRYLTDAATACYWREMVRAWRSVGYKPRGEGEVGWGGRRGLRRRGVVGWEEFR